MLFTLIKNELIKILKKGKTWIVFGLFVLLMIGFLVMGKVSANQTAYWHSPQGKIENLNNELMYNSNYLKDNKEYLKKLENGEIKDAGANVKEQIEHYKSTISFTNEEIARINKDIKYQESLINAKEVDWRVTLKDEIKNLNKDIENAKLSGGNDKEYIESLNKQIEENQYFLDNNIKPVKDWEFYPSNMAIRLMSMLGMVMLVAGIAVFMSDIISGECTPATLKFLLVQPISRGKVILSKFIAVVLTVVSMIGGIELAAFGIMGAFTGFDAIKMPVTLGLKYEVNKELFAKEGYKQLEVIANSGYQSTMGEFVLKSFLLQILFIVACCAFIFMISALFKSSMITMAVSVIIAVAGTMLPMSIDKLSEYAHLIFFSYGGTPMVISGDVVFNHMNTNFTPELGAITMIITIVVSYLVAYFVFRKRDMLV